MNIETITLPKYTWKTPILEHIERYARDMFIPVLLEDTANFLIHCLKQYNPQSILEIGTAIGYSGTIMLQTCPTATLTTMELEQDSYDIAKQHFQEFGVLDRVHQYLGDAYIVLQQLAQQQKKFDFIFLDGPKGQYIKYLPLLEKLLKKGGILFADNVLFKHMVDGPEFVPHKKRTIVVNLRKYLNEIVTQPTWQSHIYAIGDGVAVSQKIKE